MEANEARKRLLKVQNLLKEHQTLSALVKHMEITQKNSDIIWDKSDDTCKYMNNVCLRILAIEKQLDKFLIPEKLISMENIDVLLNALQNASEWINLQTEDDKLLVATEARNNVINRIFNQTIHIIKAE